jgi:hypothetical protein
MKFLRLPARKGVLPFIVFCLFLLTSTQLYSQTTTFTYNGSGLSETACNVFSTPVKIGGSYHEICSGGVTYDGAELNLATGTTSNGSQGGTAYLIGYAFSAGTNYSISITASSQGSNVILRAGVFATLPSFVDNTAVCTVETGESSIGTGVYKNGETLTTKSTAYSILSFTPTSQLLYLIIGADDGGTVSSAQITSISITATTSTCTIGTPSGLTTSNNNMTLDWTGLINAVSYKIAVSDISGGTTYPSTLTSTGTSVNFCPKASGDNVSFTVQGVCSNGVGGGISAPHSYTYTNVLAAPTGVTFNNVSPFTVSWNAVPGATFYWYEVQGDAPVVVNGTSVSDPSAELSYNQSYEVSVAAANSCVTGPYSTPIPAVMPVTCNSPIVAVVEGNYIKFYSVSGAASYNVGFENSSGTVVYQINNIGSVITSSGYTVTGVPAGSYYIVGQTNCTNGATSAWGAAYGDGLIYISSFKTQADSLKASALVADGATLGSPDLLAYPNPTHSQVNLIYTAQGSGSADVTITSEFGNTVFHKQVSTVAGQNNYSLNIGELANGVYILRITDSKTLRYQKLLITK